MRLPGTAGATSPLTGPVGSRMPCASPLPAVRVVPAWAGCGQVWTVAPPRPGLRADSRSVFIGALCSGLVAPAVPGRCMPPPQGGTGRIPFSLLEEHSRRYRAAVSVAAVSDRRQGFVHFWTPVGSWKAIPAGGRTPRAAKSAGDPAACVDTCDPVMRCARLPWADWLRPATERVRSRSFLTLSCAPVAPPRPGPRAERALVSDEPNALGSRASPRYHLTPATFFPAICQSVKQRYARGTLAHGISAGAQKKFLTGFIGFCRIGACLGMSERISCLLSLSSNGRHHKLQQSCVILLILSKNNRIKNLGASDGADGSAMRPVGRWRPFRARHSFTACAIQVACIPGCEPGWGPACCWRR
jgi:hypothetical protein